MTPEATIRSAGGERTFAAFPIGLVAMIADEYDRFLVLSSPDAVGKWEPISGAMERGETPSEGVLREIGEEAGTDLRVRPYGAIHAGAYPYDEAIPAIIGIAFAFRAENRLVTPGDDMEGQQARWVSVEEIEAGRIDPQDAVRGRVAVPTGAGRARDTAADVTLRRFDHQVGAAPGEGPCDGHLAGLKPQHVP